MVLLVVDAYDDCCHRQCGDQKAEGMPDHWAVEARVKTGVEARVETPVRTRVRTGACTVSASVMDAPASRLRPRA